MQQIMAEVSKVSNEEKGSNDVGDAADEHNSISDDHKPNYITSSGAGSPKIERELQDNREEVAQNASSSQMSNFVIRYSCAIKTGWSFQFIENT